MTFPSSPTPKRPRRRPNLIAFLSRTHGKRRFDITDVLTYLYLITGTFVMFGPVLWLVMSSFKPPSMITRRPVTFLPYREETVAVDGYERPLPLYDVTLDGAQTRMAAVTKPGGGERIVSRYVLSLVDPQNPDSGVTPVTAQELAALFQVAPSPETGDDTRLMTATLRPNGELPVVEETLALMIDPDQPDAKPLEIPRNMLRPADETIEVAGYDQPLSVYLVRIDGEDQRLAALPGDDSNVREIVRRYITLNDADDPTQELTLEVTPENIAPLTVSVDGYDQPLPVYRWTQQDGSTVRAAALVDDAGNVIVEQTTYNLMIDPDTPAMEPVEIPQENMEVVRSVHFDLQNYQGAIESFDFPIYLRNSVVVTVVATVITLLINSMAAFALSKYRFKGRDVIFLVIISTLMVPVSVILIPAFLVITKVGWSNNLWGLIIPGAATPTGVFLLRQYMLTIPDELLDSARIDGASEWRIYWQVILPLARPALAVLAIFSVMWRWNDFLWPLIVVTRNDLYTLPVALNNFQGNLNVQWNYILAMTVLTLLPVTLVFGFLQRYITTGIATTGMK